MLTWCIVCVCTDLGGDTRCRLAEIPASHRGGCQAGITGGEDLNKELFNCPEALWVLHLSLYPFNISYPGPDQVLGKRLCPGCWNMDESARLPIYLDVSRKQL